VSDDFERSTGRGGEKLLAALRILEERCREHADLPRREAMKNIWAGVLFRIGDLSLLAPNDEIGEVLELPVDITPFPATRAWMLGIANDRGTVLPIFDLRPFLFGSATGRGSHNRVLVMRRDEFPLSLLVSDVIGIRHFDREEQAVRIPTPSDAVEPFVVGGFELASEPHPVLSLRRLTQDARFGQVAA